MFWSKLSCQLCSLFGGSLQFLWHCCDMCTVAVQCGNQGKVKLGFMQWKQRPETKQHCRKQGIFELFGVLLPLHESQLHLPLIATLYSNSAQNHTNHNNATKTTKTCGNPPNKEHSWRESLERNIIHLKPCLEANGSTAHNSASHIHSFL